MRSRATGSQVRLAGGDLGVGEAQPDAAGHGERTTRRTPSSRPRSTRHGQPDAAGDHHGVGEGAGVVGGQRRGRRRTATAAAGEDRQRPAPVDQRAEPDQHGGADARAPRRRRAATARRCGPGRRWRPGRPARHRGRRAGSRSRRASPIDRAATARATTAEVARRAARRPPASTATAPTRARVPSGRSPVTRPRSSTMATRGREHRAADQPGDDLAGLAR